MIGIRLAEREDKQKIAEFDHHIHLDKLEECIDRGLVAVLYDADDTIGVLRYNLFWQTIPFLDLLYIDGSCRGRGYGRQMMAHWEAPMKTMGYTYVMLSTQEDEDAKFFYEKLGYRRIGAFLPPEQDADEIMYGKELRE